MKNLYNKALGISYEAHAGQYRKNGFYPYIVHPLRVSNQFSDYFRKTISLLHDVVEDTDVTMEQLEDHFPKEITEVLKLLTKKKGADYGEYIERISENEIAIEIKIADIIDNLSDARYVLPKSMVDRYNKYLGVLISKIQL